MIAAELRGSLLGLDEDEGANFLSNGGRSIVSLAAAQPAEAIHPRVHVQRELHAVEDPWTPSRTKGSIQIEHDQSRPELNWAVSDFDRRHRLILSWTWELPFSGNRFVDGWQISGIGTFQSGRPFTITDEDFSGFLFASQNPRPNLAPGKTLEDQTTAGSVTIGSTRISTATPSRAAARNSARSAATPSSARASGGWTSASRRSRGSRGSSSLELRIEIYNVTNTPTFRNPESDLGSGDFGMITRDSRRAEARPDRGQGEVLTLDLQRLSLAA